MLAKSLYFGLGLIAIFVSPKAVVSLAMPCLNNTKCFSLIHQTTVMVEDISLSSPCYPGKYMNDFCFDIQLLSNGTSFTRIVIESFDLESWNDYLEFRGESEFLLVIVDDQIELISYPGKAITARFVTDSDTVFSGFQLKVSSVTSVEFETRYAEMFAESSPIVLSSPVYLTSNDDDSDSTVDVAVVSMDACCNFNDTWTAAVEMTGNIDIIDITSSAFTVTWSGVSGNLSSNVLIPQHDFALFESLSTTSKRVSNLTSGTTYYIEVILENKKGQSASVLAEATTENEKCDNGITCGPNAICEIDPNTGKVGCVCRKGFKGTPDVGCIAFCSKLETELDDGSPITFEAIEAGATAYSNQKCDDGRAKAAISCKINKTGVMYGFLVQGPPCDVKVSDFVSNTEISRDSVSPESIQSIQVQAAQLQIAMSGHDSLADAEVDRVSEYFENITEISGKAKVDVDILQSVVNSISNMIGSNSINHQRNPSANETSKNKRLLSSLNSLADRVQIPPEEVSREIVTQSTIVKVSTSNGQKDAEFAPIVASGHSNSNESATSVPVKITVPASALQKAMKSTGRARTKVSFFAHKDNILFPTDSYVDIGAIATVNLDNEQRIGNFGGQVKLLFEDYRKCGQRTTESTFNRTITRSACVYWNETANEWRKDGCYLIAAGENNITVCACDHLTNFAVLMADEKLDPNIALSIWSIVGLSLSMVGLVLTIIVHCIKKEIRKRRPTRILFHICATLTISHGIFLFGIDRIESKIECTIIAGVLHYSYLTSWTWMGIYAYDMYRSLVTIFNKVSSQYTTKITIFGYGIPLLITALNAGISLGYIDARRKPDGVDPSEDGQISQWSWCPYKESVYVSENICWIHSYSFYIGFLLPVSVILAFNIFVYASVIRTLSQRSKSIKSTMKKTDSKEYFLISVTLIASTGISWASGYLMLLSSNQQYLTITSWIFASLNTLQGLIIFFCTCVRNGNMRGILLRPWIRLRSPSSRSGVVTTSAGFKSNILKQSSQEASSGVTATAMTSLRSTSVVSMGVKYEEIRIRQDNNA